jgi:hypothetical protein
MYRYSNQLPSMYIVSPLRPYLNRQPISLCLLPSSSRNLPRGIQVQQKTYRPKRRIFSSIRKKRRLKRKNAGPPSEHVYPHFQQRRPHARQSPLAASSPIPLHQILSLQGRASLGCQVPCQSVVGWVHMARKCSDQVLQRFR